MLRSDEKKKLKKIAKELKDLSGKGKRTLSRKDNRKYFDTLRRALHLFEDVVIRVNQTGKELEGNHGETLRALAAEAFLKLGGAAEPCAVSLKDYKHDFHGPFLGVSDEGSAAHLVRRAALNSPKMHVLGTASPIEAGVALDAERLAAVGEVAVGPKEYRDIKLECQGSILTTTNVGTRLNLRYYKIRPIIRISSGSYEQVIKSAVKDAEDLVEPFRHTPDAEPRAVTLFARFKSRISYSRRKEILKALHEIFCRGDFCDPRIHKLGLLASVGLKRSSLSTAMDNIDMAHEIGLSEVAIQGVPTWEAEEKISMPGLLNYFSAKQTNRLLQYAADKKIIITPKNMVDPDTVARNIWSSLQTARNMGLELGKYGLFPLTLDESDEVMGLLQQWFSDWTAAPVLYVDLPIVDRNKVYVEETIVEGAKKWLDRVARHKIPIVLIDTADKDKKRRLLKDSSKDSIGILDLNQVREIDSYARKKGIRCLWAGGITLPQTLEFGKLGVFGIYVTSAVAATIPLTEKYARDPMMTAEKEPTFEGVSRAKLLLEVGFLINHLNIYGLAEDANNLDAITGRFIKELDRSTKSELIDTLQLELSQLAEKGWKIHYKQS